jgi:hypothetical protein
MMNKIVLVLAGTTSSKKYHIPFTDKCRLVAAKVLNSTAQADTAATVTFGMNGAGHTVFTADLQGAEALTTTTAAYTDSVTEAEKEQIFSCAKPLEIDVSLATASSVTIELTVDPFIIGQNQNASA